MKKMMKMAAAGLLAVTAILSACGGTADPGASGGESPLSAAPAADAGIAASKEEVVYANLTPGGGVREVNVVNILNVTRAGLITDYGAYSAVKSLTDAGALLREGNGVTASAPAGRYYYQGTMASPALPWSIDISYTLNGEAVTPEALAGASGAVELHIRTAPNGDSVFFDNYLLQISVTLDTALCANVVSEGAALANAGRDKLVTHTVMPGASGDISVRADVTDFEMPGIEISALPFSMDIAMLDTDALTDEFTALADAVKTLNDGVAALEEGAASLRSGAMETAGGSAAFKSGLDQVNSGGAALKESSAQIQAGLHAISSGLGAQLAALPPVLAADMGELSAALAALDENYGALHAGLTAYADGVARIADSYTALHTGVSGIADGADGLYGGVQELHSGTGALADAVRELPDRIGSEIENIADGYDKSAFVPESFVSPQNENVTAVQFVFRTDKIEAPAPPAPPPEVAEKPTFWTRLLDLFR